MILDQSTKNLEPPVAAVVFDARSRESNATDILGEPVGRREDNLVWFFENFILPVCEELKLGPDQVHRVANFAAAAHHFFERLANFLDDRPDSERRKLSSMLLFRKRLENDVEYCLALVEELSVTYKHGFVTFDRLKVQQLALSLGHLQGKKISNRGGLPVVSGGVIQTEFSSVIVSIGDTFTLSAEGKDTYLLTGHRYWISMSVIADILVEFFKETLPNLPSR